MGIGMKGVPFRCPYHLYIKKNKSVNCFPCLQTYYTREGNMDLSFNKINFIYNWGKEEINRSQNWSGTPWGIYRTLEQHVKVIDVAIETNRIDDMIIYAHKIFDKLTHTYNFNMLDSYIGKQKIKKKNLDPNIPCLMFLEYPTQYLKNTYLYQDLTVDYLARLRKKNLNLMKYTPLSDQTTDKQLEKRLNATMNVYSKCKGILTMSMWLKCDLITNTGIPANKVHWVGGGCNINAEKNDGRKKNGKRFLFVGKDWERKNGALVVEAFRNLRIVHPDIELYIIGPRIQPDETKCDGVIFLGRLSYECLIDYYNLCDYFIMPSKFEAYGLVFAEALIFGLVCIGKNSYAMPEFITHDFNGYLLQDDNVSELIHLMDKLLLNRNRLMENIAKKHSDYMKKYSWEEVSKRILMIMEKDRY